MSAGFALAAASLLAAAWLAPPYARHLQYQSAIAAIARRALDASLPDAEIVALVVKQGASLGIPVRPDQVRIRRAHGRIEITALYETRLGFPLNTVDLHFRPRGRAP
jgi:hypothetical protein